MNEQRRILNTAKEDAELLSSKDEMTLSDQSGKQVDLPKAERQSIILAMSLHEKVLSYYQYNYKYLFFENIYIFFSIL